MSKKVFLHTDSVTLEQLEFWHAMGSEIEIIRKHRLYDLDKYKKTYSGQIAEIVPLKDNDAIIRFFNYYTGITYKDIDSCRFEIKPFTPGIYFMNETLLATNDNSFENVILKAKDKEFSVNKNLLAERIKYFKHLFFHNGLHRFWVLYGQNFPKPFITQKPGSGLSKIVYDFSNIFEAKELEALLLTANVGHCEMLTAEQAHNCMIAARKLHETNLAIAAEFKKNEILAPIYTQLVDAMNSNNFEKITAIVKTSLVDINHKLGKSASWKSDGYIGTCPSDTPLTYAVRSGNLPLAKCLLLNGASTTVFYDKKTPLMEACWNHNINMVKLLLEHGANPNFNDGLAMVEVLYRLRYWLLDKQTITGKEIVQALLQSGFSEGNTIAALRESEHFPKEIRDAFYQIVNSAIKSLHVMQSTSSEESSKSSSQFGHFVSDDGQKRKDSDTMDESTKAQDCELRRSLSFG